MAKAALQPNDSVVQFQSPVSDPVPTPEEEHQEHDHGVEC